MTYSPLGRGNGGPRRRRRRKSKGLCVVAMYHWLMDWKEVGGTLKEGREVWP